MEPASLFHDSLDSGTLQGGCQANAGKPFPHGACLPYKPSVNAQLPTIKKLLRHKTCPDVLSLLCPSQIGNFPTLPEIPQAFALRPLFRKNQLASIINPMI